MTMFAVLWRKCHEEDAMLSADSCERILRAGANLKIEGLSADSCVRLATAAKSAAVNLEIKGSLSADSFVRIAEAGGANVTIDLTE
jgi:hypothetical protein